MDFNNPEQNTTQPSDTNTGKYIIPLLLVAILIVVVAVFLFAPKKDAGEREIKETANLFADLKGTVYLTMAVKDDRAADLYTFDIKTKRIEKVIEDEFVKYTSSISLSGDKLAYFASPLNRDSEFFFPFTEFLQLYIYDINNQDSKKITESFTHAKRLPVWSSDGQHIVFSALPDNTTPFDVIDSWSVYVTDLKGNEMVVGTGSYPQWSPDGTKILFMKNDGLHLYDMKDGTSAKVFSAIRGMTSNSMKLKISQDGSMLAWSRPDTRELTVYDITSWEPFQMEKLNSIQYNNNPIFWPVFSPDGQYLIVQAVSWDRQTKTSSNPRLIVYDVETLERMMLRDLDDYNFDISFITDWQY